MTDTEILDYLQESLTMRRMPPTDVQIGSVTFTLGLRPGTLRELILAAIRQDEARLVAKIAKDLAG